MNQEAFFTNGLLLGTVYGFVLYISLLIKNPKPSQSRFWLGIFILSFALILFDNWGIAIDLGEHFPVFHWMYYRVVSIAPLSMFIYILKLTNSQAKYLLAVRMGWVVVGIELILLAFSFFTQNEFGGEYLVTSVFFYDYMGLFLTLLYYPIVLKEIWGHHKKLKNNYANTSHADLKWLYQLLVIIGILILCWALVIGLNSVFENLLVSNFYYFFLMIFTVFFLGVKGYLQPSILHNFELVPVFEQLEPEAVGPGTKTYDTNAVEKTNVALDSQIFRLMQEKHLYRKPKLSVADLAKELHQSPKTVSQYINQKFNMSFSDFVNAFRVEEVRNRIIKGDHRQLTMAALAYEAGFNSRSAFYRVFKQHIGASPTGFALNPEGFPHQGKELLDGLG